LPEVIGNAGLLVKPTDTAGLITALQRVLADTELRADMRHRSLAQAQKFSWTKAVAELKAVYQAL
jgi:glycosyltransferase involved in cell wall biosynthesis